MGKKAALAAVAEGDPLLEAAAAAPKRVALKAKGPPPPDPRQVPAAAQAPALLQQGDVNAELHRRLASDWATIHAHPEFVGIQRMEPQVIDKTRGNLSGFQQTFNLAAYQDAMASAGKYKAGVNFFAQNLLYTTAPHVPIHEARVAGLVDYYFKEPAPFPLDLVIAVADLQFNPMAHLGAWQSCSPDEMKHAFVRAIARDLASDDKGVLEQWRHMALTVTAEFKVLASEDDIYFEAFNMRERVITDYAGLSRTAYQRIWEIMTFRTRKIAANGAPMGPKALAAAFNEMAHMSSKSEVVTADYIAAAMTIHEKALRLPHVVQAQ